jgi:hypothetical protein
VLLVYWPVANGIFGTAPFAPGYWAFLVAWVPALLVADELRKAVVRRQERRGEPGRSPEVPDHRTRGTRGGGR